MDLRKTNHLLFSKNHNSFPLSGRTFFLKITIIAQIYRTHFVMNQEPFFEMIVGRVFVCLCFVMVLTIKLLSYSKEETEADSDDDSVVQDDCLDVTLKVNRSIPALVVSTVPNEVDSLRHDHHTAVLSTLNAMEQGKKLLVTELGDLDPIAIVD
ncbi:uncharacterized protein BX663DRAFT_481776 [Cokeromyces recurvatus]|uniref:uncharacterized protein n=1 Tax=Cokeromyces recurvatus TaxID=90255 RepID=UPI00221F0DAA|nr:uncharacterized protein BX663DRAFT_481776 [Cokeromyces recurvatus]KAI7907438.1 hypothetical protein BX663DRAFT_481776 [Cokeromyces recurvatus]